MPLSFLAKLLGIQSDTTQHKEKFISALGGCVSIFVILIISSLYIPIESSGLIVASMGASAVLLFAVPHGPLSQPWPLMGGHLISAAIGVSCYILIPNLFLAASLAVGISIGAMYYLRCIHPPGGATALSAVMGGTATHELGYSYLLTPVLINVIVIVLVAIAFNYFFPWRRYPIILSEQKIKQQSNKDKLIGSIPSVDLDYALQSMKSFTDISRAELEKIYATAAQHERSRHLSPADIILGHYYLHGKNDDKGVIRRVIDESGDAKDMIIYKIITGPEVKKTQTASRETFALWAKHEVIFVNEQWQIKV